MLVATVVGSGIMAETLTKDIALALLGNTLPTGAILVVLITILGPISGAHFNPAVSLVFAIKRDLRAQRGRALRRRADRRRHRRHHGRASDVRAAAGRLLVKVRTGGAAMVRRRGRGLRPGRHHPGRHPLPRTAVPWLVGLYITAAYWFTASTSFANPAVAIARSLTNTFSGIRPDRPAGLHRRGALRRLLGMLLMNWLLGRPEGAARSRSRRRPDDRHDLPQPRLRHVAQHAGDDPPERRGADHHRISEDAASRERLNELIAAMGIPVRELLREKGTPYTELGLDDPKWTDDQLIDLMLAHPILINRPIVVTPKGVRLCRPSEAVLDILPNPDIGRFVKEDGEVVELPAIKP